MDFKGKGELKQDKKKRDDVLKEMWKRWRAWVKETNKNK